MKFTSCLLLVTLVGRVIAAPVASPDVYGTAEDTPFSVPAIGVLDNDAANGAAALSAITVTQPSNGTVALSPDGSFHYTPAPNFHGIDQFTYKAVEAAQATIFTVDRPASIMTIRLDSQTFSTGATTDSQTRTTTVTGTSTALLTPPTTPFGTAQIQSFNFRQADAVSFNMCLSRFGNFCISSVTASMPANELLIAMNSPVDKGQAGPAVPVASPSGNFIQAGNLVDATGTITLVGLGVPPSIVVDGPNTPQTFTNANISRVGPNLRLAVPVDFSYVLTETGNLAAPGNYRVTVRFSGTIYCNALAPALQESAPTTVTINVTPVNDLPVATADDFTTKQLTSRSFPAITGLLANDTDADGDAFTAELLRQPATGRVNIQPDGSFTYAVGGGVTGSQEFFYRLQQSGQPVVTQQITIAKGADWQVLETGAAAPIGWQAAEFADGTWPSRPTPLGYGYADILAPAPGTAMGSTMSFGANPADKPPTQYFRQKFNLNTPAELAQSLILRLRSDDAAAVWLNGTEVLRTNLPGSLRDGSITYNTLAQSSITSGPEDFVEYVISPEHLVSGDNQLAVEIHQSSIDSDDLIFDLEAKLSIYVGANVTILVQSNDADADGMSDIWEAANGLNTSLNDAAADPDGDGCSNGAEFLAGTHPQQSASHLRIIQLQPASVGQMQLRFPALSGTRYQAQRSANLLQWTNLGSPSEHATSPNATLLVPVMNGQPFYRLRVVPAWE